MSEIPTVLVNVLRVSPVSTFIFITFSKVPRPNQFSLHLCGNVQAVKNQKSRMKKRAVEAMAKSTVAADVSIPAINKT